MASEYSIGDELEVSIERIVPRGFGIGFAERLTVFVSLAVPGDQLRVRITEIKKRVAFGEISEVLSSGPSRVIPPCQYFGTCGGCDFQQLSYDAQLSAKVDIIRDCLKRIGKIEYAGEISILSSPLEFDYRTRARWLADREMEAIGYRKRGSHAIVDVEHCPILVEDLNTELTTVRAAMNWDLFFESRGEIETASGDNGVSTWISDVGNEPTVISASVAGENYNYSAQAFFQANRSLTADLVRIATEGFSGATALDLYSGVGLFSIPLGRKFGRVIGVEGNPVSNDFARSNVEASALHNVECVNRSVGKFLRDFNEHVDLVVLDPPRSGTEDGVIKWIAGLRPPAISYVSCDPAILARDLAELSKSYRIDSLTALDLFPQSHHVETVARLSLK